MRRALALAVVVMLLAWARIAIAEGETTTDSLWGLAPFDESTVARLSGRGIAHPRTPEPSRVILWDEEPPKGSLSVSHADFPPPDGAVQQLSPV